jgi:CBS domain-containing protein
MSILAMCEGQPATVHLQASVADSIRMMLKKGVGAVAVVDGENKVVGVFSERDVMKKLALSGRDPETVPVAELMTSPVLSANENTPEQEALETMLGHHIRHLPVLDREGALLGMLSIRNLLEARMKELYLQLEARGGAV